MRDGGAKKGLKSEYLHGLALREEVTPEDARAVGRLVESTGFFTSAEVEIAVELVEERLARGPASGYFFVFAEASGELVGYSCYGPIPCTLNSFDLYWVAVRPSEWNRGVGGLLVSASEEKIHKAGGRRIYIETSTRAQYEPTRRFYERRGYSRESCLRDFYAPGDDKITYVKELK